MNTLNIAIDIGGTNIRIALIKKNKIIELKKIKTNIFTKSFSEICQIIYEMTNFLSVTKIGISCCGIINKKQGIIVKAINLSDDWQNLAIIDEFKTQFPTSAVLIDNDVNIAAYGQYLIQKNNPKKFLYFSFSTGISAGFVLNGKIYDGFEMYNSLPDYEYHKDGINSGIEFFASGNQLIVQANRYNLNIKTTKELFNLYYQKNKIAIKILKVSENKIKSLLATCVYMLNIDKLVIGGSVALNNKEWFQQIIDKVSITVNKKIEFEFAKNLDESTLIGCIKL